MQFDGKDADLAIFPYFAVTCKRNGQMTVSTYEKIKVSVSSNEREVLRDEKTPYGEFVEEHYKYLNKDGSVSKRYKDNPLLKTVRYTRVKVEFANSDVSFFAKSLKYAQELKDALEAHATAICDGASKTLYNMVIAGAETADIEETEEELIRAEDERKAQELKAAKELRAQALKAQRAEKKKAEEEALAQQLQERERRMEIVRRQREANEERKKQDAQKAETKRNAEGLFADDFAGASMQVEDGAEPSAAAVLFEIAGNKTISNTVFKVSLKPAAVNPPKNTVAYFTTDDGVVISNKKMIVLSDSDETVTVGFVLTSGIDYTSIKNCLMHFDANGEPLGDIKFKLNISFCSDF